MEQIDGLERQEGDLRVIARWSAVARQWRVAIEVDGVVCHAQGENLGAALRSLAKQVDARMRGEADSEPDLVQLGLFDQMVL